MTSASDDMDQMDTKPKGKADGAADTPISFNLSEAVVGVTEGSSPEAESIGALRTHLVAQHIQDGRRALAICAPSTGSGCSFVAVNLAVALSQGGVRTLLIDADMRNPEIHNMIVPSRRMPGLVHCLSDDALPFGDAIMENVLPSLSIIYSGGFAENAQELLAGPRFATLIDLCMREYDVTIVDTPPANSSADARRIASIVRYALIVARKDATFVSDIKTLIEDLKSDRAHIVGTVLNAA